MNLMDNRQPVVLGWLRLRTPVHNMKGMLMKKAHESRAMKVVMIKNDGYYDKLETRVLTFWNHQC